MIKHLWHGQTFWLHADRLLYWEEQNILIGSDFHLGKTGHFRKAGIAMPQQAYKADLQRLFAAIQYFRPAQLLVVGDMFHSEANKELEWFLKWRNDFHTIDFHLIKGNHDILKDDWYSGKGLVVCGEKEVNGIRFVHDPAKTVAVTNDGNFISLPTISGHIHPGIAVRGFAKQHLRFPCFYFSGNQCVLPAFSHFTGTYLMKPVKGDQVFAITSANRLKGEKAAIFQL